MFSGALQTYYYHSKGEDTIAVKGKKAEEESDDADDEEEPDVLAWEPPKKGTKRGLKMDKTDNQTRTAADDEYEQENDFANIDEMIKTAQQQGHEMLSNSLSYAERAELMSAGSNGTEEASLNATKRTADAHSAKSATTIPATPATDPTSIRAHTPSTPFTPIINASVSTPMTELGATASTLNQVGTNVWCGPAMKRSCFLKPTRASGS